MVALYKVILWATKVRGHRLIPFGWRRWLWERVLESSEEIMGYEDLMPIAVDGSWRNFHIHIGSFPNWRCVRIQFGWPVVSVTRKDNR